MKARAVTMIVVLVLALVLRATPIQHASASSQNVELVGQIGGTCLAVAVQGDYAYLGVGPRLVVVDVSDPARPRAVGQSGVFPGVVQEVAVAGGYAYVADGSGGLRIIDVSNPARPTEVGLCNTARYVTDVAVAGKYAYVADDSGLRIIDVSSPASPAEVGRFYTSSATGVAVAGSYAYVSCAYVSDAYGGLRVIDVSDPSNATEVGLCDTLTPGYARDVAVAGSYAYVADGVAGLRIIDVSSPASPTEVGLCDTPWDASGVAVGGGYAYVADGSAGLRIIDVSSPTGPSEVGFFSMPGYARDAAVVGSHAYVVCAQAGLRIIDVSSASNPNEVALYGTSTPEYAHDVAVAGGYAYVADWNAGLYIIDVSNPASPSEVGFYDTPGSAYHVAAAGRYAYVVDGWLHIIDVSNPASPTEVGLCRTPGLAWGVAVAWGYAYVAARDAGLRIIDVSNPASPTEVGFYDTPGSAFAVAVAGSYACVADFDQGLRVIDVSNPASPTEVGFCDTPGYANDVAVAGSYAYVADLDRGLRVIDVSNPANPTEVGFHATPPMSTEDVAVAGSYAYVADGGLRIIDVSNPASPSEVGFCDTPGYATGVAVAGSYAFVADTDGGLLVLRFSVSVPTVLVRDESGNPVSGAEVFRNGRLAGTTGPDGQLSIPGLAAGDQLVARLRVMERPAVKGSHEGGSSQNWAYRVYITSLDVPLAGEPTPWIVSDPRTTQVLTIKKSNALIGFNIVASVEWDASSQYLEELKQAFQRASEYLYDATDGQMLFERVTIYDNNQRMGDADYQICASNQEWPRAHLGGILQDQSLHIFLGRYFDGQSANQGSWAAPNGYRTQVHEFGHYGLGLLDSYYYYNRDGGKQDSACTSTVIRTNGKLDVNATLMYYQYEASEFSMRGVSGMWSSQCEQTDQWKSNGESDWETIVRRYQDSVSPARWELKTPASYGSVVAGPHVQPVDDWQAVVIGSDASTGACEPPITWRVKYRGALPAPGASVVLRKGDRTIDQGKTSLTGEITVLGAAEGDELVASLSLGGHEFWQKSVRVQCNPSSTLTAASAQVVDIILEPAPFTLRISTAPGGAANQTDLVVKASSALSGPPQVDLTQSGAASAVAVALAYDAALQAYTGTATLDANLPPSGIIIAKATDTTGQEVQAIAPFALQLAASSQDVTVWSADGQAELYLPAGSLSTDGRIAVAAEPALGSLPDGLILLSGPYTVRADEGLVLTGNASLSLYYLDTGGTLDQANVASAQVYRWDGQSWQALPSASSQEQQVVSAAINTFGTYALMAERQHKLYLPLVLRN